MGRVGSLYQRRRNVVYAATLGVMIVSFGQWLNGGFYAVSSLVWFLLGACDHEAIILAAEAPRSEPGRRPAPYRLQARSRRQEPEIST